MKENWKTISEAPHYAISDTGRVKRVVADWQRKYAGRILKPATHRGGYLAHVLCTENGKITRKVHRLVCEAFNGPPPSPEFHAAHFDGNVLNNTPENLRWATAAENAADKDRHGRTVKGDSSWPRLHPEKLARGDKNGSRTKPESRQRGDNHYARTKPHLVPLGESRFHSKLTDAAVADIRKLPFAFGSGRILADRYGVSMALISAVRKGRVWTHLPMPK